MKIGPVPDLQELPFVVNCKLASEKCLVCSFFVICGLLSGIFPVPCVMCSFFCALEFALYFVLFANSVVCCVLCVG